MKKCLALILALAMVLCLAACTVDEGSSPSTASTASDPSQQSSAEPAGNVKYKIGMVANNIGIDDNQTECDRALREYAKSFTDVELTVLDAGGDSNTQISMIEDFIQQKVDLIIVWACDSLAVVTGLREAKEAGVPIMCTNNPIDESGYQYLTAFVGPDHYEEAATVAKVLNEDYADGAKVVQITGLPGYDVSTMRQQGFEETISDNIHLLETQNGDWNRETAQQVMESFILKYGDELDAVYCADDNMAVGAYNAISAANMDIAVYACCFIGNEESVEFLEKGIISCSVLQHPAVDAKAVMDTAYQIVSGGEFEFKSSYPLYTCKSDDVRQVMEAAGLKVW